MLTHICQYLKNWFERAVYPGDFSIAGGMLFYADGSAPPLLKGQYYRIVGSTINDGVHRWGGSDDTLLDEDFSGAIWSMAVPKSLADLSAEIDAWTEKYAEAAASPYQSESFGGYSYAKGYVSGSSNVISWQVQFKAQLAPYRKI